MFPLRAQWLPAASELCQQESERNPPKIQGAQLSHH